MPTGYRQIADAIRDQIRGGHLAPGDRLPGIRAIGEAHSVTPQTAAAAIRLLAQERWVIVGAGRATRVADTIPTDTPSPAELAAQVAELAAWRAEVDQRLGDVTIPGDIRFANALPAGHLTGTPTVPTPDQRRPVTVHLVLDDRDDHAEGVAEAWTKHQVQVRYTWRGLQYVAWFTADDVTAR